MKLTQATIRKLIKEHIKSLNEISDADLEQNAITQISNLLVRLDGEGLNAQQILNKSKQAFDASVEASKDLGENNIPEAHDHEDDMAKRQMYKTARDASQVFQMIRSGDNYPAWLQSKMTKVADYIGVIKNYLEYDHVVGEKLDKDATAGDYVKDFRKSDAPQFKGKSKKKKQEMAIAAYLDAQEDK